MDSKSRHTEVWGHRGWAARFPHNSMVGIGAAFGVADAVEIDVRRTLDGRLVLSHDPAIDGMVIAQSEWSALRSLDLGMGQRLILLEEALGAFADRPFNIEIKNHPGEPGFDDRGAIALEVARMARANDLISSFHWPILDMVRGRVEGGPLRTGLLLDNPVPVDAAVTHATQNGHAAVIPSVALLMAEGLDATVARVHDAGLRVCAWTVNDPAVAIRLAEAGVDAIITDEPGPIATVVRGANQSNHRR